MTHYASCRRTITHVWRIFVCDVCVLCAYNNNNNIIIFTIAVECSVQQQLLLLLLKHLFRLWVFVHIRTRDHRVSIIIYYYWIILYSIVPLNYNNIIIYPLQRKTMIGDHQLLPVAIADFCGLRISRVNAVVMILY